MELGKLEKSGDVRLTFYDAPEVKNLDFVVG
jgi:hypothetical protein